MAKFLVGAMPFVGHVNPLLTLVGELVRRGHEVGFYTAPKFRAKIEAVGARYFPPENGLKFDDDTFLDYFPERRSLTGLKSLKYDLKYCFVDSGIGGVRDFQRILEDFPADVILADSTFVAAGWTSEIGGPPWAAFNPLPLSLTSADTPPLGPGLTPSYGVLGRAKMRAMRLFVEKGLFRDVTAHIDKRRKELGLPTVRKFIVDHSLSPYLYLQATVESFEYPRSDLAPQIHFIGPVIPEMTSAEFSPPSWWAELHKERPVVHVTQGTVATNAHQLLVPTINALKDMDVLVVATTGGKPIEDLKLDTLPENVRIEPFIPHAHLLPHVDAMITNGGYNGVHMALSHGVPLIAAGDTEDKPEVCARIEWAGVGINLRTATPSEQQIRDAVDTLLMYPSYRHNAEALADEIKTRHAPTEAAKLLEELAETKAPVLRR